MNLSEPFIRRPVMTTLLTLTVIVLGISSFLSLPISNLPDVDFPVITVQASFPGASPETMANTVATPLEKEFMTISGLTSVTSTSTLGSTSIVLQFDIDRNIDLASVDTEAAIVRARPRLPPDIPQDPTYRKINPSATPILYVAVTSETLESSVLWDYANTLIAQRISTLSGVSQVSVYGSPRAVRAQVDPGHLAQLNLALPEIAATLANQNQYKPLGQFDGTNTAMIIYDNGGLLEAKGYNPLIARFERGAALRVDDVGEVVDGLQKDRSFRRFIMKGIDQDCVVLAIQREPGANTVQVAARINAELESLKKNIPGAIDLITIFDRSESIRSSIEDAELTLIIALVLVVFVIYVYLGKLKETLIPSIAMPISVLGTFMVMSLLGFTIDILSILALTLAMGFIVDDAIVVLENIVRHVEKGEEPFQAAIKGSKEIMFTIISMTLSLIAVFIPLIFMPGLIGKMFREFAITLATVTFFSGVVSLTLTPMLASRFVPKKKEMEKGLIPHLSHKLHEFFLLHYEKMLHRVVDYPQRTLLVGASSIVLTIYLFAVLPKDFIPEDDIGFFIAYTEAQEGTSSEAMNDYQKKAAAILKNRDEIKSFVSISSTPDYRKGILFAHLIPEKDRAPIGEVIRSLGKELNGIAGLNVYLRNLPSIDLNIGSQVRGTYQYLITGLDSNELYPAAEAFINALKKDPVATDVSSDLENHTPQANLKLDRDYASTFGITAKGFEEGLFYSFSANRISRIQTPIDQYDVILELSRDLQKRPETLNNIYVRSEDSKKLVPIRTFSKLDIQPGLASSNHYAQFPAVTASFNINPEVVLSKALERIEEIAQETLPSSLTGQFIGAAEAFQEATRSLEFLLVIAILTIYIILGILYESYIHPLTILSTLPPALVGALLTLLVIGKPLSLYAYLGLIVLIGIVKKNGIMMVDFALENVRVKKESPKKSIIDACLVRFRPIMMTTVSTIMGAVPIAIGIGTGAEARRPLGFVIIGGMIVSQVITLFLTPVIYLYFETLREKYAKERE